MDAKYDDFIDPDLDMQEGEHMEAQIAFAGHPHIVAMFETRTDLLVFHATLHMTGQEDSDQHSECLSRLSQIDQDGTRAFKAIWS